MQRLKTSILHALFLCSVELVTPVSLPVLITVLWQSMPCDINTKSSEIFLQMNRFELEVK